MKKEFSVLFILLIMSTIIPFTLAGSATQKDSNQIRESLKTDFGSIVEGTKVENVFKREVSTPSIVRFILGIRGDNVLTWEKLIITIGAWILFFIAIHSAVSVIPFFMEKEKIQFGVSFIVLLLICITIGLSYFVDFIISISDFVLFFDKLGPVKIFFGLLVIFLGIKALNMISSKLKEKLKLEKATQTGEDINFNSKIGKIEADNIDKN